MPRFTTERLEDTLKIEDHWVVVESTWDDGGDRSEKEQEHFDDYDDALDCIEDVKEGYMLLCCAQVKIGHVTYVGETIEFQYN